jgi:hypothetical protein
MQPPAAVLPHTRKRKTQKHLQSIAVFYTKFTQYSIDRGILADYSQSTSSPA